MENLDLLNEEKSLPTAQSIKNYEGLILVEPEIIRIFRIKKTTRAV